MIIDDIANSKLRERLRQVSREALALTGYPLAQVHVTFEALGRLKAGEIGKAVSDCLFVLPSDEKEKNHES